MIPLSEKEECINLIKTAIKMGARQDSACKTMGISTKTYQNWLKNKGKEDMRKNNKAPSNKLSEFEKEEVMYYLNCEKYRDLPPSQIVPRLIDEEGKYIASESTFYRILRENKMLIHRGKNKIPERNKPEELKATKPNQVWSWDITYLASAIKGRFYYLYLIMDVYSRMIVGFNIYENESSENASELIRITAKKHNVNRNELVLHSDNGSPMKGATMLATLQWLGILPSFSRPSVSNDNPFSESLFKTMKYRPDYPKKPFENLEQAKEWVMEFVNWYNNIHLHSKINFVTPFSRHFGFDEDILSNRNKIYLEAKANHPERWSKNTRNWDKPKEVILNPKEKKKTEKISA